MSPAAHTVHVVCDLCQGDDPEHLLEKSGGVYVRCRRCGVVYVDPPPADPMAVNTERIGDALERYVRGHRQSSRRRTYRRVLRLLARYRRGGRLLEIGSNAGGFLDEARRFGWNPLGIEPVAAAAEEARREYGVETLTCTLEESGLPDDAFDVVYSNAVFEHLASPSGTFREAARVLRPGGVLYVKTVNINSYTYTNLGIQWDLLSPTTGHLSLYTPETIRRFAVQAGLEPVWVRTEGVRSVPGGNPAAAKVRKFSQSLASRFTGRGDRVILLARKPAG